MAGLVLVVAWHAVAWKLRSNYRKPASVIRFCAVSVVVAIIAGVAIVIWADAAFALLALVVALPALAWLLQAIANRRLATRMAELRSSRVNSSEEPARALRVPAPASLRLDRRSLWTMKFDGLAGIRTDLWLMAREFLRSMWHTKFDVGRSLGDVLPRPVAGLQRHENSGDGTLFLWVFEMEPEDDVINIARQAGPVYFLRGGGILAKGRYRDVLRLRVDDVIIQTPGEVDNELALFDKSSAAGADDELWPAFSMLCADEVWKRALDGLIERAHTVVMDLSLFSKGRLGCEYELRQLLDRIPLGQIVLITGRRTDEQLLVSALNDIWNTMPEDSPNGRDMSSSLLLVKSRYLRSRLRSVSSSSPGERPSPAERERDSLRLLLGLPTD